MILLANSPSASPPTSIIYHYVLQEPLTQIFGVFVSIIDKQFLVSVDLFCGPVIDFLPVLEGLDVLLFTVPRTVHVAHPVGHSLVLRIDEIRYFPTLFNLQRQE